MLRARAAGPNGAASAAPSSGDPQGQMLDKHDRAGDAAAADDPRRDLTEREQRHRGEDRQRQRVLARRAIAMDRAAATHWSSTKLVPEPQHLVEQIGRAVRAAQLGVGAAPRSSARARAWPRRADDRRGRASPSRAPRASPIGTDVAAQPIARRVRGLEHGRPLTRREFAPRPAG